MKKSGTEGEIRVTSTIAWGGNPSTHHFGSIHICRYVLCPGCKSVDTLLDRDSATRLMHLRCQQCGASRTVSAIKSGFVARVTKRTQAPG